MSESILERILAHKRVELREAQAHVPLAQLEAEVAQAEPTRSLRAALARPPGAPLRVLAEIKRASPSAGEIRPGADPAAIARAYVANGAAGLSVLTDEAFFDGHPTFLRACRDAVGVPLLRKDFIIDPYQVWQARAWGADAILLIVAALSDAELAALAALAHRLSLEVLVETHTAQEAQRAVALGLDLLGVNHRDLATFAMDMSLAVRLRPLVPANVVMVAESGIRSPDDMGRMAAANIDAVLVGEHLMRAVDPGLALAALRGAHA